MVQFDIKKGLFQNNSTQLPEFKLLQLQAKNQKISIHQFSIVLKIDFVSPFILIPQYNIFPNFCQFSKYESIFDHYAAKDAEQVFIPSKNLTSSLFKFDDTLA